MTFVNAAKDGVPMEQRILDLLHKLTHSILEPVKFSNDIQSFTRNSLRY